MPILNSPILSGDISGTVYETRLEKIKGYPISLSSVPTQNQALVFNGSEWTPSNVSAEGGGSIVELITAAAGQSTFNLSTFTYVPSSYSLAVYRNGLRLILNKDYIETSPTVVTLVQPVAIGSEMIFEAGRIITRPAGVLGDIGTFAAYISAPAVYGKFYGDGSSLTGIATTSDLASTYFKLTGGSINGNARFNGNVTITGDLSCTGTQTFANTVFVTTSALSVVNLGSGAALYVGNNGTGDIASFYDIDANVEVLHIGGNNGTFPNVGVKTSSPNKTLTVNGEISASSDIWTGGKFRGDGSLLTGIVGGTANALPLSGGTLSGSLSGTIATFSTSVSAPALSGVHFGDGSNLTNLDASDIALGTLNTARLPAVATFSASVSAPALSGTFFGDGSNLTNLDASDIASGTLNTARLPAVATFSASVSAPALSGVFFGDGSKLTGIIGGTTNVLPLSGGTLTGRLDLSTTTETKSTPSISLSAISLDLAAATFFSVLLNSNVTFTFANTPASPRVFSFMLQLVADGILRTITWPTSVRWGGGVVPTPTSTLNKVDTYSFLTHDGGTNWFGFIVEQNS